MSSLPKPQLSTQVIYMDRRSGVSFGGMQDFVSYFREGDRLVVNDAATLPASLFGELRATKAKLEVRLASLIFKGTLASPSRWRAVVFGEGNWRTPTELRTAPPVLRSGEIIEFRNRLTARIESVEGRLIEIEFSDPDWARLWSAGRPVQYSYLDRQLEDWDQQTLFSSMPVAVEPPSASFALNWELVFALRAKGVEILRLTHATGLSDLGSAELNRLLPFPEVSVVPSETRRRLSRAREEGARIVALGTGTVRALESWGWKYQDDGPFTSTLKISPSKPLQVVTGLLTGLHEVGASHLDLLGAFVEPERLRHAYEGAKERGYRWHEYGDVCLII